MELDRSTPGALRFASPSEGVTVLLTHFKDSREGLSAEIAISGPLPKKPAARLTAQHLNLSSGRSREQLAKRLSKLCPQPSWDTIIETVCVRAIEELRKGEAAVSLSGSATGSQGEAFILNPILYQRHPTLIYGPGDSGKSLLCLYFALLLSKGDMQNGLACSEHTVLYLDWELSAEDLDARIGMLTRGHREFAGQAIQYRRLTRSLQDCQSEVAKTIAEVQASVLIIDSLGLAAGGELERAETAIRFFQSLRELAVPALLIGHVAKHAEEDKRSPFGSVYFYNLARSIWEVKKTQDEGTATLGLYHRKNNLGPRKVPLGFTITFQDDACTITTADLAAEPDLERSLPIADRIAHLLQDREGRAGHTIADALGLKHDLVRVTLNRYKDKKWTKSGDLWTCG